MKIILIAITLVSLVMSTVHEIDVSNYESVINGSNNVFIVKFYSEFCGSCVEFNPAWKSAIKTLEKTFDIGQVNIDKKPGMELAKKLNILNSAGIPSIAVFGNKNINNVKSFNAEGMSSNSVVSEIGKLTNRHILVSNKKIKASEKEDI